MRKSISVVEHIQQKLLIGDGCWEWGGSRDVKNGYGCFSISKNRKFKNYRAHRAVWEWWHGQKPKGILCHKCDNPACCRPSHLYEGDFKQNIIDSIAKRRFTPARLTWDQVCEIRAKLAVGVRPEALAKRFKIAPRTVKGIKYFETWKRKPIEVV